MAADRIVQPASDPGRVKRQSSRRVDVYLATRFAHVKLCARAPLFIRLSNVHLSKKGNSRCLSNQISEGRDLRYFRRRQNKALYV